MALGGLFAASRALCRRSSSSVPHTWAAASHRSLLTSPPTKFSEPTASAAGSHSSGEGNQGELHVSVEPLAGHLEGVSVLSLTRTSAANAIGRQLLRELIEATDLLRQERTTRCVVLRSTVPGVFCAGADLKERAAMTHRETLEFVYNLRNTFSQVQALPMPTIAAIDGLALGGGAELALAADIRIAGQAAQLGFPEAQLGIIPGAGGTQRLPRLVGPSRAKELCFTGRRVSASTAEAMGLVDHVVPEGRAFDRALDLAKEIIRCAPLSNALCKAAINNGLDTDTSTGMQLEDAYYSKLIHTKDRQEGLVAFAEKRPPSFTGE